MKENKKIKTILTILQVLCFLSFFYITYSIILIDGIETELRYVGIGILFILNILLLFLRGKTKNKKIAKKIIYIIIMLLFIIIQFGLGFFIHNTYSSINGINKSNITYTSAVVVLNNSKNSKVDSLKGKKIGIVVDKTSIDGYILSNEIIKKYDLSNKGTIVEYEDIFSMMKDLYNKKLDAILTTKDYPSMFRSLEGYKDIEEKTKIIEEYSKNYKKEEIAEITGNEMTNYYQSSNITEPFTVLLMGIDSTSETLNKNATGNGDALMLVTFNPKTLNATILSIPRDSFVYIPNMGTENKITHAAWGGTSHMIKTIEGFTDINIDYYVKINFQGVIKLVNLLGGITVDVPIEFCESNAHRQTSSNKLICLKEGVQKLTGEQALALARHRKTLLTGDLQRGSNQQLVVQGIANQAKNIKSASQALNILDTMSKSMDTNFSTKQLLSFYDIFKTIIETSSESTNLINIQQLYLSGVNQGIYDERTGLVLSDYIINQSSLDECIQVMKRNLGLEKNSITRKMEFDIKDKFEMTVIGENPTAGTKTYTLLPDFTGRSQSYAENWLRNNGIKVTIVEKEVSSGTNGKVLSQNLPEDKRIDLIGSSGITLTVAKVIEDTPTIPEPLAPTTPGEGEEQGEGENQGENNQGEDQGGNEEEQGGETTPTDPSDTENTDTSGENTPNN